MTEFLSSLGFERKEIQEETKNLFTIGSLATLGGSVFAVTIVSAVLASLSPLLDTVFVPLILAFVVIYGVAYFLPSPEKLTREEAFVAFFNSFIVYAAVQGIPV